MNRVLPPTSVWDRFSLVSRSVMNASNSSFFHDGLLFSASLIIEQGRHAKSILVHWSQRESLGLAHEILWAMANMAELYLLKVISSCCRALMLSHLLCRNPFPYSQFLLIRSTHATVVGVGPPRLFSEHFRLTVFTLWSHCLSSGQCLFSIQTLDTSTMPQSNDSSITGTRRWGPGGLDHFLTTSVWGVKLYPLRTISDCCFKWNGHDIHRNRDQLL